MPADSTAAPAFKAAVFDMDGVVTRTAGLHAAAWKALFDEFLRGWADARGETFVPFDQRADYRNYVDGKPREAGVRAFLSARGIVVPEAEAPAAPGAATVQGLAERKDTYFEQQLQAHGVALFETSMALIRALRAGGVRVGVVTSSRHGRDILARAGIDDLFDARLDGNDVQARGLAGKPAPDAFLACAQDLGVTPAGAVVLEDSAAGVEAGRAGGFGLVIGVDRGGNRRALEQHGADLVVDDLGALTMDAVDEAFQQARHRASWRVEQEGFDPARERDVESLFAIGNGYLGVRGALETPVATSQGDLFVAGVYDRKHASLPYSEHEFMDTGRGDYAYSELVPLPFPFRLRLSLDGEPLSLDEGTWSVHRRLLDMREGVLEAETRFQLGQGRIATVRSRRSASMADQHLLLQEVSICLENHSATVVLETSLNDPDLAVRHPHLTLRTLEQLPEDIELYVYATHASGMEICVGQRVCLAGPAGEQPPGPVRVSIGETLVLRRWIVVYTSRDSVDPVGAAVDDLRARRWETHHGAFDAHARCWRQIWQNAGLEVGGSPGAEQALRFHAYHLTSAADHDPTVSVGARALTGRAYEGHVFWDVEVFMLPFFLHTSPVVARHLLGYRHHTLDGARRRAGSLGLEGACYAWESTVTGDDATPTMIVLRTTRKEIPIFTGTQQIHVTADVAYGVWRYWQATHDHAYLSSEGAEILVETARFWASRCVAEGGALHIRGVVGPDEYHHDVNDNAYTNWMARFNLETAVWALDWLDREHPAARSALSEQIGLKPGEPGHWTDVASRLYFPQPTPDGVIEQFEGFFDLDPYPLQAEERFRAPISRLFDWDAINGVQLLKQADVLMLPFLFPQRFSRRALAANYHYYEPRTDHGSSLSPGVHAALAARLGLKAQAERYWQQSLTLDLSNVMGNSTLGVHPACMGATWQALVFHLLGVRFEDGGPVTDADAAGRLPERWSSVALNLQWRGRSHRLEVTK